MEIKIVKQDDGRFRVYHPNGSWHWTLTLEDAKADAEYLAQSGAWALSPEEQRAEDAAEAKSFRAEGRES